MAQYTDNGFDFYKVFASYGQQAANPVVMVWLSRRTGQSSWDTEFVRYVPELLENLSARFSIDTNRVYAVGGGEPVPAIIETIRLSPELLAGAVFYIPLGTDNISVTPTKHVPIWNLASVPDFYSPVAASRRLVSALRKEGNPAIYTEFATAPHPDDLFTMMCMPSMVDWLLAQRRGFPSGSDPLLVITEPTGESTYTTGAASLSLTGTTQALSESITGVTWENVTGNTQGNASGTNQWAATNIPLVPGKTNTVIVTATTTSWAPAYGGNTTFSKTLFVFSKPIRASLISQPGGVVLEWTGGVPPFQMQKASQLAADWIDVITNAVPPVPVRLDDAMGFYRIIGR